MERVHGSRFAAVDAATPGLVRPTLAGVVLGLARRSWRRLCALVRTPRDGSGVVAVHALGHGPRPAFLTRPDGSGQVGSSGFRQEGLHVSSPSYPPVGGGCTGQVDSSRANRGGGTRDEWPRSDAPSRLARSYLSDPSPQTQKACESSRRQLPRTRGTQKACDRSRHGERGRMGGETRTGFGAGSGIPLVVGSRYRIGVPSGSAWSSATTLAIARSTCARQSSSVRVPRA